MLLPELVLVGAEPVTEGDTGTATLSYTVKITGPSTTETRVDWQTAAPVFGLGASVATPGTDYVAASGTVVFPPGSTEQVISVQIMGDRKREISPADAEYFDLVFTNLVGVTVPLGDEESPRRLVTIIDNDQRTLAAAPASLVEGNAGLSPVTITVSLNDAVGPAPLDEGYTFAWATGGDGVDFVSASGNVTIPAGQTTGSFVVQVKGDKLYEIDEAFYVTIIPSEQPDVFAVLTVFNDDTPPVLTLDNTIVTRGEQEDVDYFAWFRVRLNTASGAPVTVQFNTEDGTALAGEDYTATSGIIVIAPGERTKWIPIPVFGDEQAALSETFKFRLTGLAGATIGPRSVSTANIEKLRVLEFFPVYPRIYAVSFQTGLGQGYVLEQAENLDDEWRPITGLIQGSGAIDTELRYCTAERCFFHVRAIASPPSQ
jgi:hypothetical protein